MKLVKRILLVLFIAAIAVAIWYSFQPQPVPVDISTVEKGMLRVTVNEDGKTRIKDYYIVASPLSGRLTRIALRPGDDVYSGETLIATIEPMDPSLLDPRSRAEAEAREKAAEARFKQSKTAKVKAEKEMQNAESRMGRMKAASLKNAVNEDELDRAVLQYNTRAEDYRSANFAIEIAKFELEQAKAAWIRTKTEDGSPSTVGQFEIKSPITGRVLRVFQESAKVVQPGNRLVELGDPQDLEVVIDVLSSDAVKIEPGNRVLLEQWGGEKPLDGRVRLIEPSAFTKISALGVEEQRVNVVVDFKMPQSKQETLGDGFRMEARIVIWEKNDVLKVPTSALFRNDNNWYVFVIEEGKAATRKLQIGQRNGLEAEILEGLSENERIIVHPSDQVTEGVQVVAR